METSTSKGAGVEVELSKKARVSQRWPWMSQEIPWVSQETPWVSWKWPWVFRWGGASVEASPRVSWGSEASDEASPCESRGQPRGVLGWWS